MVYPMTTTKISNAIQPENEMIHPADIAAFTDSISSGQAETLYGLFLERVKRSPQDIAYRSYSNSRKEWYDTSWQQVAVQVAIWQTALAKENLSPGDRVAVNLKNCKEWVFFDQAAMALGLVVVPLYELPLAAILSALT